MARGCWTYKDDNSSVLSEADCARADAIAKRIGAMDAEIEHERWRRERDDEHGPCDWGCSREVTRLTTYGAIKVAAYVSVHGYEEFVQNRNMILEWSRDQYGDLDPACQTRAGCTILQEIRSEERAKDAERQLERDWLEEQLDRMGLRMERPYEHWNEDERYMEWMETRYDSYAE